MRSLFVKIFFWFWLAMILVAGAAVVSLHTYMNPEKEGLRTLDANFKDPGAYVAMETLEQSGPVALRQHLERGERHMGIQGFRFNDAGTELTGRAVPREVAELNLHVKETGTGASLRSESHMYFASNVPDANGTNYIFVTSMPHRKPGEEPGPPPDGKGPHKRQHGPGSHKDPLPFPFFRGPIGFLLTQPRILVLILSAVVLMSGIVCYGLARHLTGPLQRLRSSARQLAEGDLSVRVGAAVQNRRDEMGELGRDFDFMAERIETLISSQRRLLRDMSHELRSPLARLNVAVGLVRQRTGPDVSDVLDRIEYEAQRLNDLIGQLLTLTRLEGDAKAKQETEIDLAALLLDVVADARFEAQSCNRKVQIGTCVQCLTAGTPELLRSAIENVVRYGLRYTPEGSSIEISLQREHTMDGPRTVILVRDLDPGVPEDAPCLLEMWVGRPGLPVRPDCQPEICRRERAQHEDRQVTGRAGASGEPYIHLRGASQAAGCPADQRQD